MGLTFFIGKEDRFTKQRNSEKEVKNNENRNKNRAYIRSTCYNDSSRHSLLLYEEK